MLSAQAGGRTSYGYSQGRNHARISARKYRGYDVRSNTDLGRDGYRRYCVARASGHF